MPDTPVIHWEGQRGYWDMSLLEDLLKDYPHYETDPPYEKGGILIVAGRYGNEHRRDLQKALNKMPWVVLMIVSDEHRVLDWQTLTMPEKSKVWRQYLREKDMGARPLPVGYRPETRKRLSEMPLPEKDLRWFYAGQQQHAEREACVKALKNTNHGMLHVTGGFGKGLDYPEYLSGLSRARLAPNPAGNCHADCFRVWEALECGALPCVAPRGRDDPPDYDFWSLFNAPFPRVKNWSEFKDIPDDQKTINKAVAWWQLEKRRIRVEIEDAVKELAER